ncbi:MAG: pyridoxamine 5'-phosphate oxidase family protein [Gammaproteobacteria bacterium]
MPALPEKLLHGVLDRMPVARLAVLDATGRPEALPIVFARVGPCLYSPVDGKPKKHGRLARLAHIERNPAVQLVLDHYAADWTQLWWVKLTAEAAIVEDGAHADWQAAVAALHRKYPQYRETTTLFTGVPTMIVLPWERVRWWAANGETGIVDWLTRSLAWQP